MPRGWPKGRRRGPETVPAAHQQAPPGAVCVPLNRGWVAWIDAGDLSLLAGHCYLARPSPCGIMVAARSTSKEERAVGLGQFVIMANEIMRPAPGMLVDHLRHDAVPGVIDNRRANLQFATAQQNAAGGRKPTGHLSSVFKGVSWDSRRQRWTAKIMVHYKTLNLGRFKIETHAAYVYDLAALRHFGQHALTNFPLPGSTRWVHGGA